MSSTALATASVAPSEEPGWLPDHPASGATNLTTLYWSVDKFHLSTTHNLRIRLLCCASIFTVHLSTFNGYSIESMLCTSQVGSGQYRYTARVEPECTVAKLLTASIPHVRHSDFEFTYAAIHLLNIIMYFPWHDVLSNWAAGTGLHVDALGLVTILGSEEVNNSVGRLVSGSYVEYLPLLGAFMLASDRFTEKRPGFTLYNFTSGIQTTELAGWFSRWLKAQGFSQVRDIVTWDIGEKSPRKRTLRSICGLLIGFLVNGMLIVLTGLSQDWWGFANALAMVFSVVVRVVLVSQRQAGIDDTIRNARIEAEQVYFEEKSAFDEKLKRTKDPSKLKEPTHPDKVIAKVIVVMDDSKVVTIRAPAYLIGKVFTKNPPIPNKWLYRVFQAVGWAAFGLHIVTLGMAALHTQIYTAVVLIVATIASVYKTGCDDWRLRHRSRRDGRPPPRCWVSSTLSARCSEYPDEYANWSTLPTASASTWATTKSGQTLDPEKGLAHGARNGSKKIIRSERRQDLYAWLDPNEYDLQLMNDWYLVPHRNKVWMSDFETKIKEHRERLEKERFKQGQVPSASTSTGRVSVF